MSIEKPFRIVEVPSLRWPSDLHIPSERFRLFVAADATDITSDLIAGFANNALKSGMVYLCAWGLDCERVHDVTDEVVVDDDLGDRLFVGLKEQDTIMTTWHESDTLEQALDFFIWNSVPTDGFEPGSNFWLAIIVANPEWAARMKRQLEANL